MIAVITTAFSPTGWDNPAKRAGKWLARMLRGQEQRWVEIEPVLSHLRLDVEQLRVEAMGPRRAAG